MRAVVYGEYQALPEVTSWSDPVCPECGVVVKVGATGVCRSDWHAWMGHDPVPLPHVPGHELAGTVVAAGRAVRRWRLGDRQQTAAIGELGGALTVGEIAVVADTMEAVG